MIMLETTILQVRQCHNIKMEICHKQKSFGQIYQNQILKRTIIRHCESNRKFKSEAKLKSRCRIFVSHDKFYAFFQSQSRPKATQNHSAAATQHYTIRTWQKSKSPIFKSNLTPNSPTYACSLVNLPFYFTQKTSTPTCTVKT